MDWATATFFDRVVHSLWLDPEHVRAKFDIDAISKRQSLSNKALLTSWQAIAPGSDAAVVEFDFHATGNAKRKLLRRLDGHILKRRGGFKLRSATPLQWLPDYALAYAIVAQECGGTLVGWNHVQSPMRD